MSNDINTKLLEEVVELAERTDDSRIIDNVAIMVNMEHIDMDDVRTLIAELKIMNEVENGSFISNY